MLKTYTIQTPAAMFKGFTVTQFHTPETAQAAGFGRDKKQSKKDYERGCYEIQFSQSRFKSHDNYIQILFYNLSNTKKSAVQNIWSTDRMRMQQENPQKCCYNLVLHCLICKTIKDLKNTEQNDEIQHSYLDVKAIMKHALHEN